jgi:tetratricopeptide (TPR) repeat protein
VAGLSCCALSAQMTDPWTLAQDAHFEVYSHTGDATARRALVWFEQLRTFYERNGLLGAGFSDRGRPPIQVIGFRSEKEFEEFRTHPLAGAFYLSDGARDYIILAGLEKGDFAKAAHEYAHYVLHANGVKLPTCLNEGLAEFFSTLHLNRGAYELGGDLPERTQTLRENAWLPLADLLNYAGEGSALPAARERSKIFYAESWALADMLVTSPQYAARFGKLISEFNTESKPVQAFQNVYGVSLEELAKNLAAWVGRTRSSRVVLSGPVEPTAVHSSTLSGSQAGSLLAHLSFVAGHLERARERYEALLREQPENADLRSALGAIALRQGNREEALKQWRLALTRQGTDADLWYRYALLAEEAGLDLQSVKAALERAVGLSPHFDDARFHLALLENQAGEYGPAIEQLQAMRVPEGARRYSYWITLATAFNELDQRKESTQAAHQALQAAQTDDDRMLARRMAYQASTDLTVQFATDAEGRPQMTTTRVPHGTTEWNPFIEPSDQIQHGNAELREVLCADGKLTGFILRTPEGPLSVEVPDPRHVLIRNGPDEFECGVIQKKAVEVDYAIIRSPGRTTNVLRGMTF